MSSLMYRNIAVIQKQSSPWSWSNRTTRCLVFDKLEVMLSKKSISNFFHTLCIIKQSSAVNYVYHFLKEMSLRPKPLRSAILNINNAGSADWTSRFQVLRLRAEKGGGGGGDHSFYNFVALVAYSIHDTYRPGYFHYFISLGKFIQPTFNVFVTYHLKNLKLNNSS